MQLPIHTMAIVAVVAACTFLTRLAPFLLFGRKREPSPIIQFLGKALPPAVIAILVIYCIKSTDFLIPARRPTGKVSVQHMPSESGRTLPGS